jgi:hypothetical protein
VAAVAAGALLAVPVTGCSHQPAAARASVQSCVQFGVQAIRHHVTVTSLPPACQGLPQAQVNHAVATALHAADLGGRGKAGQRERIIRASHFLQALVKAAPAPRSQPPAPALAAGHGSRTTPGPTTPGLATACTWLITVGLGLSMMVRWLAPGRRRDPAVRRRRVPPLNGAHLGLASTGLLVWVAYLATGVTGLAWAGAVLLLAVASLGVALVFAGTFTSAATGPGARGGTADIPAGNQPVRPPVLAVGIHIIFAVATILLAFLTAIGTR